MQLRNRVLVLVLSLLCSVIANAPPDPIVVDPSEKWEGSDGSWSSFNLYAGSPSQAVRVLVDTSSHETRLLDVGALGVCIPYGPTPSRRPQVGPPRCSDQPGAFKRTSSRSWELIDDNYIFSTTTGRNFSGGYGLDTISISSQGDPKETVNRSAIVSFFAPMYSANLGYFGISPRAEELTASYEVANQSDTSTQQPSFIWSLKSNKLIPSLSWAFTAGSSTQSQTTYGSLVFGGYDASRFVPNDVSFPFNTTQDQELSVYIRTIAKIEATNRSELLPAGISAVVDSSQSSIWLPEEACKEFEDAFGLIWNSTTAQYTVNDTQHDLLTSQNASVVFELAPISNDDASSPGVNITLPYSAFDLTATPFNSASPVRYFPLQRAENMSHYILGRTFLQEAYLIVDYERRNFSISQINWSNTTPQPNIIGIPALAGWSTNTSLSETPSPSSASLGAGAIAGITVGAIAGLAGVAGLLAGIFIYRKKRRTRTDKPSAELENGPSKVEMNSEDIRALELDSSSNKVEMPANDPALELGDAIAGAGEKEKAKPLPVEPPKMEEMIFELPAEDLRTPPKKVDQPEKKG